MAQRSPACHLDRCAQREVERSAVPWSPCHPERAEAESKDLHLPPTIKQLLDRTAKTLVTPNAHRDAQLLLLHILNCGRAYLLTHPDHQLNPEQLTAYQQLIARRARCEPIQYILGEQEFFGLAMKVTPAVLIPRPETEHLVEAALASVSRERTVRIADVGAGSGAIAIALAHSLPLARITALDISPSALAIARENAGRHGVAERIHFLESDLLAAAHGERFDMIVSNPPYVPDGDYATLEPQVRDFEPRAALFAGPSGLEVYRHLIPQAWKQLGPGGWLLMEIGAGQDLQLRLLLEGWSEVEFVPDLQGIPRVAMARKSPGCSRKF